MGEYICRETCTCAQVCFGEMNSIDFGSVSAVLVKIIPAYNTSVHLFACPKPPPTQLDPLQRLVSPAAVSSRLCAKIAPTVSFLLLLWSLILSTFEVVRPHFTRGTSLEADWQNGKEFNALFRAKTQQSSECAERLNLNVWCLTALYLFIGLIISFKTFVKHLGMHFMYESGYTNKNGVQHLVTWKKDLKPFVMSVIGDFLICFSTEMQQIPCNFEPSKKMLWMKTED